MDWERGALVILEKVFFYGAAIWLLRAARVRLWRASTVVALVLAAIEAVQTHMPKHTPEITDPLLALFLGFAIALLTPRVALTASRGTEIRSRSRG
jgi:hypothetical protein